MIARFYYECFLLCILRAKMAWRNQLEAFGWCCLAFGFLGKVVKS